MVTLPLLKKLSEKKGLESPAVDNVSWIQSHRSIDTKIDTKVLSIKYLSVTESCSLKATLATLKKSGPGH